jgi:hypothetical protein
VGPDVATRPLGSPGIGFFGYDKMTSADLQDGAGTTLLNAAFVDASVRGMSDKVSPAVLEAFATVAGGEEVGRVGEE